MAFLQRAERLSAAAGKINGVPFKAGKSLSITSDVSIAISWPMLGSSERCDAKIAG